MMVAKKTENLKEQSSAVNQSSSGVKGKPEEVEKLDAAVKAKPEAKKKSVVSNDNVADSAKSASYMLMHGGKRVDPKNYRIAPFNFNAPKRFSHLELDFLRQEHEQWNEKLSTFIALFLKAKTYTHIENFSICPYQTFIQKFSEPVYITVFNFSGFKDIGLCVVDSALSLSIVNRLLGGKGAESPQRRFLTEIEQTIINELILGCVQDWCQNWEQLPAVSVQLIGSENNTHFIPKNQKSFSLYLIVELSLEVEGKKEGNMFLALPCSLLDPIVEAFHKEKGRLGPAVESETRCLWRESYSDIDLPVFAEWDLPAYSIASILDWEPGSLLKLPMDILKNTQIKVQNTPKFVGEIGLTNQHISVQISKIIDIK